MRGHLPPPLGGAGSSSSILIERTPTGKTPPPAAFAVLGRRPGRPRADPVAAFRRAVVLPSPGAAHRSGLGWCSRTGRWTVVGCERGHGVRIPSPCERRDCGDCSSNVRHRRTSAAGRQLGGVPSIHAVFTFPDVFRPTLGIAQVGASLRRLACELDAWPRVSLGVRLGTWAMLHPAGARDPSTWAPHVHAVIPLVGLDPSGALREVDGVDRTALADIKRRWGAFLGEVADVVGVPHPPPNIRISPKPTPAATWAAIGYAAASWPDWYAGSLPRNLAAPFRWGLAANNARPNGIEAWRAAVASPPSERARRVCPHCGEPAAIIDTVDRRSPHWRDVSDLPIGTWGTWSHTAA